MPKPRGLAGKARLERRMRRWDVARKTLGWGGLGASVGGAGAGIGGVPHASWIALAGMAALAGKGSLERRLLKQAIGRPLLARRLREKFKGLEYTDTALRLIEHLGPMV